MEHTTATMLAAHPEPQAGLQDLLIECVEACFDCAQACTACADACVAEVSSGHELAGGLARCIRLDQDCADLCLAAGRIASRQTSLDRAVLRTALLACAEACRACGQECARHEHMEHCQACATVCRRCEQACLQLYDAFTTPPT